MVASVVPTNLFISKRLGQYCPNFSILMNGCLGCPDIIDNKKNQGWRTLKINWNAVLEAILNHYHLFFGVVNESDWKQTIGLRDDLKRLFSTRFNPKSGQRISPPPKHTCLW